MTVDLRKTANRSRDKLPLGSTRWATHKRPGGGRFKVRVIKVAHTSYRGCGGKWVNYARHLYERHKGPVPRGKRVIHADGDLENFALDNLVLGTAADVLWIHCHSDPEKSAANYRAASAATAAFNRERAAVRRALGVLPTRWYAVDLANRVIVNSPGRKFHDVTGMPPLANGSGVVGWRLGWPGVPAVTACLLAALARVHGPRSWPAIVRLVEAVRREFLIEPAEVGVQTLRSSAVSLIKSGLVERVERGRLQATKLARETRGPVCPFVFLRGADLQAEPYRGFKLIEPKEAS
jgi:hypothetical protein